MLREIRYILLALTASAPLLALAAPQSPAPTSSPVQAPGSVEAQRFQTPDEGAKALLNAARSDDLGQLAALFGSSHAGLLSSGDDVEDKNNRADFVGLAEKKMKTETVGEDKAIIHVGDTDWPFPIPLVKKGESWQFDAEQGKQEILDRRIGRNELSTLAVMRGYVEAQFDYASADRDDDDVSEYAQKLRSEPGKFDGLYWEAGPGQPQSPLGPLIAEAKAGGYQMEKASEKPVPYHGYFYRILTRQGPAAPGGKYDYIINGNMIAGFGVVAYPAQYAASGIMTFIVNHQGKVYQKDLGPQTAQLASGLKEYNPDTSWTAVAASD